MIPVVHYVGGYIDYHKGDAVIVNLINSSAAAVNWISATKILRRDRKAKQVAEELSWKMS